MAEAAVFRETPWGTAIPHFFKRVGKIFSRVENCAHSQVEEVKTLMQGLADLSSQPTNEQFAAIKLHLQHLQVSLARSRSLLPARSLALSVSAAQFLPEAVLPLPLSASTSPGLSRPVQRTQGAAPARGEQPQEAPAGGFLPGQAR
jgi:hypothetical protein